MRWPWGKSGEIEERAQVSIADPALLEIFQIGTPNYTGITMGEHTALTVSGVWRAVTLISTTVASLDSSVSTLDADGFPEPVAQTWLDDPGVAAGMTKFEFWETVLLHLLLHGNAFLIHVYNGAGALVGLWPIHPLGVTVERDEVTQQKVYRVSQGFIGGHRLPEVIHSDLTLTHIPALSTDGIRGFSPIQVAKNSLGVAVAGERATARTFGNGFITAGIVTPEDEIDPDEAEEIKQSLQRKVAGWDNAGEIAVINRRLKFTPWTMTAEDAQFLQSRQFQIEEIARWFGIPPYELMQTEKQTSWGTGIEAQQRGLARQVLGPWVKRIEARMNWLLLRQRKFRFDFASLERPTPAEETSTVVALSNASLITKNEGRARLGMPPHPDGDELVAPVPPALAGADPDDDDDNEVDPKGAPALNGASA